MKPDHTKNIGDNLDILIELLTKFDGVEFFWGVKNVFWVFRKWLERWRLCGYVKCLDVDQKGWRIYRILFEYCINLFHNFRSLEQHWNPFHSLNNLYGSKHTGVCFCEAAEWVQWCLRNLKLWTRFINYLEDMLENFQPFLSTSRPFL